MASPFDSADLKIGSRIHHLLASTLILLRPTSPPTHISSHAASPSIQKPGASLGAANSCRSSRGSLGSVVCSLKCSQVSPSLFICHLDSYGFSRPTFRSPRLPALCPVQTSAACIAYSPHQQAATPHSSCLQDLAQPSAEDPEGRVDKDQEGCKSYTSHRTGADTIVPRRCLYLL